MQACAIEGIDPKDLVKKRPNEINEPGANEKIASMRLNFYESKRNGKVKFQYIDLLRTARICRKDIILKEKPKSNKSSPSPKGCMSKSEMNKKQLDYFLKTHQRRDINLKYNLMLNMECMLKREQIFRETENDFLKSLQLKEEIHKRMKEKALEKTKQDIEKNNQEKKVIINSKKIQAALDEREFQEKSKTFIEKHMKEQENKKRVDESHRKMVLLIL